MAGHPPENCPITQWEAIVMVAGKEVSPKDVANLHREATGAMPGHAPGEEAAHAAAKGAKKAAH